MSASLNNPGYYLGKLCKRGHAFEGLNQSLRNKAGVCYECNREYQKNWMREKREDPEFRSTSRTKARERYWSDPAAARLKAKQWYDGFAAKNPEEAKRRQLDYRKRCKENIRESRRKWYEKNRVHCLEYNRRYVENNRSLVRATRARHGRIKRARRKLAGIIPYSSAELLKRFDSLGGKCLYCGSFERIEADHFVPLVKGGVDCLSNLVPACKSCNSSKNNRDAIEWFRGQSFYSEAAEKRILSALKIKKKEVVQLSFL